MNKAFFYIKENGGINTEECYPYQAVVSTVASYYTVFSQLARLSMNINQFCSVCTQIQEEACRYNSSCVGATVRGVWNVARGSETDLQDAVQTVGPVSVFIEAYNPAFQV